MIPWVLGTEMAPWMLGTEMIPWMLRTEMTPWMLRTEMIPWKLNQHVWKVVPSQAVSLSPALQVCLSAGAWPRQGADVRIWND